jgi:TolB-like protein/DNA-binding winged helix-turn-helix (wHTH) protein
MERQPATMLRIGAWCVDPNSGQISGDGGSARLEARTMRLLLDLAEHAGEVVSIDDLLDRVWSGVTVSPDSVYQAVASLRRLLGDDPKHPTYIATVPRLGYRMIAKVSRPDAGAAQASVPRTASAPGGRFSAGVTLAAAAALCLALVAGFLLRSNLAKTASSLPQNSIAVLPFLDLTEKMTNGPFADGMTEELIDKLSRVPGLRVPPPTSSFYFKDKQVPLTEMAKSLGVLYILDGSVRRSSGWVRVDTRLVRADDGYVIWSATYDRPEENLLAIQDDIAGEVTKALKTSIRAGEERKSSTE